MNYRQELDGLRSIAVLAVLFFHGKIPFFTGGFVGVDIFFVLSGFLVTSIIIRDIGSHRFSILDFYERRIRRILPAFFVVLFCCLPLAWFLLIPSELVQFFKSLRYALFFLSNIFFYNDSGYFAQAAELKPLLHTWSLSIEVQYYFIVPFLFLLGQRLAKKWHLPLFTLLLIASFTYMLLTMHKPQNYAFFMLHTRFWELALGGCLALYSSYFQPQFAALTAHTQRNNILSLAGLGLICYAIFVFGKATSFPGINATIPTLGTVLILVFTTQGTLLHFLLTRPAMVALGGASYSVYLWHYPLLVFLRIYMLEEPSVLAVIAALVLSITLGFISWKWIEKPFRNRAVTSRKQIFTCTILCIVILYSLALVIKHYEGFSSRSKLPEAVAATIGISPFHQNIPWPAHLVPSKHITLAGSATAPHSRTVAFFGDSHARAFYPVLDAYGKKHNILFAASEKGGCPPILGIDVAKGNFEPGVCLDFTNEQLAFMQKNKLNTVLLTGRWTLYTTGNYNNDIDSYFLVATPKNTISPDTSRNNFVQGIQNTVDTYTKLGAKVFVLLQVPQHDNDPRKAYTRLFSILSNDKQAALDTKGMTPERHFALQQFSRNVFTSLANVTTINADNLFLTQRGTFGMGTTEYSYYRDDDHLSDKGGEFVFDNAIAPYLQLPEE